MHGPNFGFFREMGGVRCPPDGVARGDERWGSMNEVDRWAWPFAFAALGCLATPASDGSGPTEDNQRREPGATDESELSFVAGLTCSSHADCGRRSYCKSVEGQCGAFGVCEARPRACAQIHDPVCGCDDQTHANPCLAASAGVSIQEKGECRPAGERCGSVVCDQGLDCCNPSCGICVPPGDVCTQEVCE